MRLTGGRVELYGLPLVLGLVACYLQIDVSEWLYSRNKNAGDYIIGVHEEANAWWAFAEARHWHRTRVSAAPYASRLTAAKSVIGQFSSARASQIPPESYPPVIALPHWARLNLARLPEEEVCQDGSVAPDIEHWQVYQYDYAYNARYRALAIGWPMRAWARHAVYDANRQPTHFGAIELNGAHRPILPIFPGVIVNTLLFALPWYALFFGASAARRWRRRRRGLCPRCAYDLAGTTAGVCPECGAGVARRSAAGGNPGEGSREGVRGRPPPHRRIDPVA